MLTLFYLLLALFIVGCVIWPHNYQLVTRIQFLLVNPVYPLLIRNSNQSLLIRITVLAPIFHPVHKSNSITIRLDSQSYRFLMVIRSPQNIHIHNISSIFRNKFKMSQLTLSMKVLQTMQVIINMQSYITCHHLIIHKIHKKN